MFPVSSAFINALHDTHTATLRCEVRSGGVNGRKLLDLYPTAGSVTIDSHGTQRRTLSLNLVDDSYSTVSTAKYNSYSSIQSGYASYTAFNAVNSGKTYGSIVQIVGYDTTTVAPTYIPTTAYSALTPYGNEIWVWRGIKFSDGTIEEAPLGVFVITEVNVSNGDSGTAISVSAVDRSIKVSRAKMTTTYASTPNGYFTEELKKLLSSRWSDISYDFPAVKNATLTNVYGNLLTNPSFDTNTTGWSGSNATIARVTTPTPFSGTGALSVTCTSAGTCYATTTTGIGGVAVTAGVTYTASAYVRTAVTTRGAFVNFAWYNNAGTLISTSFGSGIVDSTTYQRTSVTATAPATAVWAAVQVSFNATATSEIHYVDAVMMERSSVLNSYYDTSTTGSYSPTYVSSTAHNFLAGQTVTVGAGFASGFSSITGTVIIVDSSTSFQLKVASGTPSATSSSGTVSSIVYDLPITIPRFILQMGDDPWVKAVEIANGLGYDLYFSATGVCTINTFPSVSNAQPNFTYLDNEASALINLTSAISVDGTYNGVNVTATGTDKLTPYNSTAWDLDSSSPTYRYGGFGEVPIFVSSNLIGSQSQCDATAQQLLGRYIGASQAISWNSLVNPAQDVYDVVQLKDGGTQVNATLIIDSLTIPLGAMGTMSAKARAIKFLPLS